MRGDIVQALLYEVIKNDDVALRKYFQIMAKYKYDDYQQFSAGMRFIERLAIWLNQFKTEEDKAVALSLIKDDLVFLSSAEINILVSSCFSDKIKNIIVHKIATAESIPSYKVHKIVNSTSYSTLLRQSLFCGLSDGARMEVFRRANAGIISHEQIYQTYELSEDRADKLQEKLVEDLKDNILKRDPVGNERQFKSLFLLDDFSASGTSFLKVKGEEFKGKIGALYANIFAKEESKLRDIFDIEHLDIHVVLYVATEQARDFITDSFSKLKDRYGNQPTFHELVLLPKSFTMKDNKSVMDLCLNPDYYDKAKIEDEHTGENIQLGYGICALPLVLSHNCPNNALTMLWAYEGASFEGLFPRIPRHKEL